MNRLDAEAQIMEAAFGQWVSDCKSSNKKIRQEALADLQHAVAAPHRIPVISIAAQTVGAEPRAVLKVFISTLRREAGIQTGVRSQFR